MCGICGVLNAEAPAEQSVLQSMLQSIVHRGPDDEGMYCADNLALGMRRLSIIDLAGGQQPMYNEDGQIVIVFNGEVYNYIELAEDLKKRGHKFKTVCDTEVIVHLYEEMGVECVQELRGMFAFALYDMREQRVFIARDRLGIKPLYYTQVGDSLVFGSEIKAIMQHPQVNAELDLNALNNFLSLKYVPSPQTLFKGVHLLEPGHRLIWTRDNMVTERYWDVSFERGDITDEGAAQEQLEALLEESVRLRLRSDVPFGAFLSGGIDSSLIVALMSQEMNQPVKTFTVGFEAAEANELPYARMIAERFQTDHHEVMVNPDDFPRLTEKIVYHLDQPIADQATLATYMVSSLAAQHVKMVLTGEGGDELFAGYARYAGEQFADAFDTLPGAVKKVALAAADRLPRMRRQKIALYALAQSDEVSRYVSWFPLFNADRKEQLLTQAFKGAVSADDANQVFARHLNTTDAVEPLHRMLYVDTKLWLADDLLARGDKMTMAASLEGRVPILDHKLVEFAASLPPTMKLKGMQRKYLLKKVAGKHLPDEIITRKKQGFPIPISLWFRTGAKDYVRDMLSPDTVRRRGLFNPAYVEQLVTDNETNQQRNGNMIWALVNLEHWHQLYID